VIMSQANGPTNEDRYTTTMDMPGRETATPSATSQSSLETDQSGGTPTTQVAGQQASQVASIGVENVKNVANEAATQMKDVAGQAKEQFHTLVGQTKDEMRTQAESKGRDAASGLRTLSDQIRALAEGRPEEASKLTPYLDDARQRMMGFADTLEQRGPQGLMEDATRFARRKPGTFLMIAAVAGFGIGRMVRAGAASQHDQSSQGNYGNGQRWSTQSGTPGYGYEPSTGTTSTMGSSTGTGALGSGTYGSASRGDIGQASDGWPDAERSSYGSGGSDGSGERQGNL